MDAQWPLKSSFRECTADVAGQRRRDSVERSMIGGKYFPVIALKRMEIITVTAAIVRKL